MRVTCLAMLVARSVIAVVIAVVIAAVVLGEWRCCLGDVFCWDIVCLLGVGDVTGGCLVEFVVFGGHIAGLEGVEHGHHLLPCCLGHGVGQLDGYGLRAAHEAQWDAGVGWPW